MIRAGLFLYDRLGGHWRNDPVLPGSRAVRLDHGAYSSGLNGRCKHGFIYSDCRTDDARLVVANARDAVKRGAQIHPRTELIGAERLADHWQVRLSGGRQIRARMIANAAGPWVKQVLNERLGVASSDAVRLVRGSHVVFPRLYGGDHAFILQNDDRRIVFMIPYQRDFTLVGTTDISESGDPAQVQASDEEVAYLCQAVGRYLNARPSPADVIWRYAGVRPLYDDGSGDPSAVTRDYTLRVDTSAAPVLSVFGGKLTTYRHLSEQAVTRIQQTLNHQGAAWTHQAILPGGDLGGASFDRYCNEEIAGRYPWLPLLLRDDLVRRHGAELTHMLGYARSLADLGRDFGGGLTECEVDWMRREEWAQGVDDIIWRRSKCGLRMSALQRIELQEFLAAQ
jgi:glycerol-3-phosphate dehydrogenase